jgi:hypothetical protein
MKSFILAIFSFCFLQTSYAQSNQKTKGNYFIPKGSYFERTIKPYNYQLTLDTKDSTPGKITFWRTEPIFDPILKAPWTPNITFTIYPLLEKEKCTNISLNTKAISHCEEANIGGDMLTIGSFILVNQSPCVECANKAKIDYCRNILKRLFEYITDTNTSDLNYLFGQLPIQKSTFVQQN